MDKPPEKTTQNPSGWNIRPEFVAMAKASVDRMADALEREKAEKLKMPDDPTPLTHPEKPQ